jgi:beta-glucosidase
MIKTGISFLARACTRRSTGQHALALTLASVSLCFAAERDLWKDPAQPAEARARDLVSKMSLEEKASQILANPPAIERLGIPAYSHRNECLHGVAHGKATVFPQAIAMAATWDTPLIKQEADIIAIEGRAKHNEDRDQHNGNTSEHCGLNFYSPNINIFRDPRWGRGQETYGEDPYLTSQMAIAFITGLQGDDSNHPKVVACAKHFAVHSGPEKERHHLNAQPPERDLYDTYLPAFEASVRQARVGSVMGAYSALYGKPCCADPFLLTQLLRETWHFDGVVFSDGGAIGDIWAEHQFVPGPVETAAAAVKAGCDVSSGAMGQKPNLNATDLGHQNNGIKGGYGFYALPEAVKKGLITGKEVDAAVIRELRMRFRLGMFDPHDQVPLAQIGMEKVDTPENRALALKVAQESIVLLKNDGILPLDKSKYKRIAVIGPNADDARMQNGNYTGRPSSSVTILEGIRNLAGKDIEVTHEQGCPLALRKDASNPRPSELAQKAIAAAKAADLVVFVGGLSFDLEKEEGNARTDVFAGFTRGDRTRIDLLPHQEQLLKSLHATGKPVILINCTGSALAIPWEQENLPAIVQAWYPGEEGGTAVAQVLFGEINPAGRLPITFYASTRDLPPFEDYSMKNRTYRYFQGKPLYAFGHGLNYTKFDYANAKLDGTKLSFTVKNTGQRAGDEVAQIYYRRTKSQEGDPNLKLVAFTRLHLPAGQSQRVTLTLNPETAFRSWDTAQHRYVVQSSDYELLIGGASDDIRLTVPAT